MSSVSIARLLRAAAERGNDAARDALSKGPWTALFDDAGPLAPLFAAKREAVLGLLRTVRAKLDTVAGRRRRLELQVFPPPFQRLSGFPLDALGGQADAVGIKLYTMHWPMIARLARWRLSHLFRTERH